MVHTPVCDSLEGQEALAAAIRKYPQNRATLARVPDAARAGTRTEAYCE